MGKIFARDYQGAMQYFEIGLANDPESAQLFNNVANIYHLKKYYSKAINHYNKAIFLDSDNPTLYFNRGVSKLASSKTADAQKDFETALSFGGSKSACNYEIAKCQYNLKQYEAAIVSVNKAIEHKKNIASYFILKSDCILRANNEVMSCIESLDQALILDPENAEVFQKRGELKLMVGDKAGAKKDFKSAKSISKVFTSDEVDNKEIVFLQ